ncbi:MAG: hypothetical protein AAFU55_16875, partial [Pseudomonadota bacterium]
MTGANGISGRRMVCALAAAFALLLAAPASAEDDPSETDQVALIADRIEYDEDTGVVTASGMVQVFYQGRTLTTDAIV